MVVIFSILAALLFADQNLLAPNVSENRAKAASMLGSLQLAPLVVISFMV